MMTQYHQWYYEKAAERTILALKRNNFEAKYVAKAADALDELWKMIPEGASVGVGGSLTLNTIGFFEEAQKRPIKLLNPIVKGITPEEGDRIRRAVFSADFFVSSSNAITEDGQLFNIDATGNRVAPMMFGPKKVVLICGANKIVKNLAEAQQKVQELTAPMNVKRLGYKDPCGQTGACADCSSPERICNCYVILAKKPRRVDFMIYIVGEFLGL